MILRFVLICFSALFIWFSPLTMRAQEHLSWTTLADVKWNTVYDSLLGTTIVEAEYGATLKKYDTKVVIIKGYIIPLDAMGFNYALSRTNYASCFFCGQAGPETVMEIKLKPKSIPPHKQNELQLSFKGTLRLQPDNRNGLHYILEQASEIE